ncbi:pyridoxamine 5'-phosphate oxidase family protein, partial [Streptomyces sp. NPDC020125]
MKLTRDDDGTFPGLDKAPFDVAAFLARPLVAQLATEGPRVRPVWFLWEDHA